MKTLEAKGFFFRFKIIITALRPSHTEPVKRDGDGLKRAILSFTTTQHSLK